jgi:trehalose 6-phosphate phosphatase
MVKYLFDSLNELNMFKDHATVIITDIDGTISEIGSIPKNASITPSMRSILQRLSNKFKSVGVLTGRDINDALNIIKLKKIVYMGNHGLQKFKNGKIVEDPRVIPYIPVIKDIKNNLQQELDICNGFSFDYKKLSLTVHYNSCTSKDKAREKILDTISAMNINNLIKIVEGRGLIEIRPPVGHDKGTIIQEFVFENHINKIMYLGDDVNDISAFNKLKELRTQKMIQCVNILVNSDETPNYVKETADFYVKNVGETQKLLSWLGEGK